MEIFKNIPCGKTGDNGNLSHDYYSLGYEECITEIDDFRWYDVLPYAPALWVQQYKENTRRGKWWLHRDKFSNICIEYAVSGTAEYYVDGKMYLLSAGELLLTYPGASVTVSDHKGGSFHRIIIIISGGIAKIAPETLGLLNLRKLKMESQEVREDFKPLLERTKKILSSQNVSDGEENSRLAYDILLFLTRLCHKQSGNDNEISDVLTSTLNRMNTCKLEEYSISTLASKAGVSRMTLTTLFRKHLNTTPLAYWMKLKMEHAKQLLINSNMPVKAIAADLGFRSQLYFSTVFRRHFGVPPTAYRKKHRSV
ncbi:MAG: helix-turn-helix domain-containing protein [Lentisphaeria bacterium]|nr:helix-turn-helix domain-containing protein [Lentisphaeria bacterium]